MIFNSITKAYYYSIVNCREGTYVGRIVLWSSWCILPLFNHQWHTDFLYCYSKVNDNVAVKVEIISNINIIITSKYFLKHNISGEDGMRRISQSTQLRYKMKASFCQYQTTTFHVTNIKNQGNQLLKYTTSLSKFINAASLRRQIKEICFLTSTAQIKATELLQDQ